MLALRWCTKALVMSGHIVFNRIGNLLRELSPMRSGPSGKDTDVVQVICVPVLSESRVKPPDLHTGICTMDRLGCRKRDKAR